MLYANTSKQQQLPLVIPFTVVITAIILAIMAQSWINFLICGELGLVAFFFAGMGKNNPGFKLHTKLDKTDITKMPHLEEQIHCPD
jgi:hypothetical protein